VSIKIPEDNKPANHIWLQHSARGGISFQFYCNALGVVSYLKNARFPQALFSKQSNRMIVLRRIFYIPSPLQSIKYNFLLISKNATEKEN
jgi:hypothetical protein